MQATKFFSTCSPLKPQQSVLPLRNLNFICTPRKCGHAPARLPLIVSRGFSQGATRLAQQAGDKDQAKASPQQSDAPPTTPSPPPSKELSEEILNLPNVLTLSRILSVPVLGYLILHDRLPEALVLLFVAGFTDILDGWLARKRNSYTVFGSIADPAADKLLMTVMVATLGWKNLLPTPLAALILLRDIGLVLLAFRIRYTSLPPPMTLKRYFNPHLPSAQVQPTQISKYNTFLQLLSVGGATLNAALLHDISGQAGSYWAEMLHWPLMGVWGVTAVTTVVSGWGYFVGGAGYRNVRGSSKLGEKIGQRLRQAREEALKRARSRGKGGNGPTGKDQ